MYHSGILCVNLILTFPPFSAFHRIDEVIKTVYLMLTRMDLIQQVCPVGGEKAHQFFFSALFFQFFHR